MSSEVLQEILTAIENEEQVRCFCPKCGQMVMMEYGYIDCPFDCGCEDFQGFSCPSCSYQWTSGYDDHLYTDNESLIKYNIMRFSV